MLGKPAQPLTWVLDTRAVTAPLLPTGSPNRAREYGSVWHEEGLSLHR
ncbi:MAG: hypothetical protein ACRDT4_11810 [Micromonosporaceae bacterium]